MVAIQRFRGARQQRGVNAHRHEQCPQFQVMLRCLRRGHQNARRFARGFDHGDRLLNGGFHLRMLWITGIAHVRAQIRRADEHTVYPLNVQDLRQVFHRLAGFDLHQHTHFGIGVLQIPRHPVPVRSPRQRASDAADAVRRVARGTHRVARLFGVLHHRHQQRLRADVQQLLDLHRVVPGRAHHRMAGVRRNRL